MQPSVATLLPGVAPGLRNAKIVLVSPKEPGNIGSVLRAAANFDAGGVVVVSPRCDPFGADVHRLSVDSPLLRTMTVLPDLRTALQNSTTSIGFTRRAGKSRTVHPSFHALSSAFPSLGTSSELSLVFGREESGLDDGEVALCGHACAIPTSPAFPSLNLSHAVAVVLSSMYEATVMQRRGDAGNSDGESILTVGGRTKVASHAEIEALLRRAVALLDGAGIDTRETSGGGHNSNHARRKWPVGHLRAVLSRSQATTSEVRAMHGLLRDIEGQLE